MNIIKWDGQPISKPGIYSGVPISIYHQQLTVRPSASRSGLWSVFDKSPAHYFARSYLNPGRADDADESEALLLGRAAHHLLLGEANFAEYFVFEPTAYPDATGLLKPWNNNATFCRDWHKAEKATKGRDVLKPRHLGLIRGMAIGLGANPLVHDGEILNGLIEHTIVWQDEETGIWCKIRPDAIPMASDDVADLKTIADITDDGLEKAIGENGLYLQGAMTRIAWRKVFDRQLTSFNLVFTEKTEPHVARVRGMVDADLDLGEDVFRASLDLMKRCLDSGSWPGPGGDQTDAQPVAMKPWSRSKAERRLAYLNL